MSSWIIRALLCAAALFSLNAAAAEPYPTRRVSIIVPFSAGGSTDTVARVLASRLQGQFNQAVIVENRPGASGNIAGEYVARSAPDGYTLFMGTSTSIANVSLFKSLPFDILKDLKPVSQAVLTPLVMVARNDLPAATIDEAIKLAQTAPKDLTYGSGGAGTSQHLAGALFAYMTKAKMVHVPYKGAAPAMTDLIAGNIDLVFAPLVDALPFIKTRKVKAIALTTLKRSPQLPDLPTLDTKLPGFNVPTWNGVFVPAQTPPEAVERLATAIATAMKQPETRKIIEDQGSEPIGSTPEQFRKYVDEEVIAWRRLVEISGAKAE